MFGFVYCFRLNIFASNISNLMLPLGAEGAEGAGGCESYPTFYIPNKYTRYFFNDSFIYFVVAFSLFGTSKDVILQFCKTVRESSR